MNAFFQPASVLELPRYAGVPSFMRLPVLTPDHPRFGDVDIGIFGAPWDGGTTNRPGARHGPRGLRDASTMIRAMNPVTGVRPFEVANCADLGDVGANPIGIEAGLDAITAHVSELARAGIRPLMAGGDHLCTLPVLRGLHAARGSSAPLGFVQFDAHTDLFDSYFGGQKLTHGTPFRRAIEEGLIDPERMVQVGIRGSAAGTEDVDWGIAQGVRIIRIEEWADRGTPHVMAEVHERLGQAPAYATFDIDVVDPAYAPGTGTPEIGGVTSREAQGLIRGLSGLNLVGADLVEVAPPFDPSGVTAWLGASLIFEILCIMASQTPAQNA
ncbi:MAG: agmatinase [Pseudomonadota bacterium]